MSLELPRMLYRAGTMCVLESGVYDWLIVKDQAELDEALAGGWHLDQYAAKAAHEAAQQPPAPDVEDEPVTREALAAKAAALGIKFDGRWGDKRLAEAIAAAQG